MKLTDFNEAQQALLKDLHDAVMEGDEAKCVADAEKSFAAGIAPLDIIEHCLTPTIREVGEAFNRMDLFLPEMLSCAEAMEAAIKVLEPHFDRKEMGTKGTIILGTVKGDIHDIGKNIFRALLDVNGYKVIDIGRDIAPAAFVDQAQNVGANIIAMSGLLSTSLSMMRDTIQMMVGDGIREKYKVIIGGGPTSQSFADKIGADGYADTAYDGVLLCNRLLNITSK
jgi:corrinoid protein of di/trimethylamine methyltransferase